MGALLPHHALLLAGSALTTDDAARARIDEALTAPGLDWGAAARLSVRHGVAQRLACQLRALAGDAGVPQHVTAAFARVYAGNARRNTVLFGEAARVMEALHGRGIDALALKGVALAATVYPDPALRNFSDIDILVPEERFSEAEAVLVACGYAGGDTPGRRRSHAPAYVAACREDILTDTLFPEFDPSLTADVLARHGHRVTIELHRGLFSNPDGAWRRADLGDFWCHAAAVDLSPGSRVRVPSPEAMLVHLCAHARSHGFGRLAFPLDIALVTQHYAATIDWDRVAHLTARFGEQRAVYAALDLARREFGAVVPAKVLEMPVHASAPVRLTAAAILQEDSEADLFARRWRLARDSRERAAAAFREILPTPSHLRGMWHGAGDPPPTWLLYLVWPTRLAWKLAGTAVRAARVRIQRYSDRS